MLTPVSAAVAAVLLLASARAWALARRAAAQAPAARLRVGGPPSRLLPPRLRAVVAASLVRADLSASPEAAVGCWAGGALVAGMLASALGPEAVVLAVAMAGVAIPAGLVLARDRHERRLVAALPSFLERTASALRAGGTIRDGLQGAAGRSGPLDHDLARIEARLGWGASAGEALAGWARERPLEGVKVTAGALGMVAAVGGRAADSLDGLAAGLRDSTTLAAEARSLSAQARLSAVVVGLAPLGYLCFSALVDPRALRSLMGTWAGRACLVGGLALDAGAAAWMRRVIRTTS